MTRVGYKMTSCLHNCRGKSRHGGEGVTHYLCRRHLGVRPLPSLLHSPGTKDTISRLVNISVSCFGVDATSLLSSHPSVYQLHTEGSFTARARLKLSHSQSVQHTALNLFSRVFNRQFLTASRVKFSKTPF